MREATLEDAIDKAWATLRDRVQSKRNLDFDYEFTLQFRLAWEVARFFNFSDRVNVRFEVPWEKIPTARRYGSICFSGRIPSRR